MSIRFKITNPIADADAVKVYRATEPMLDEAMPAALATLAPTVTEYADETAVRNTLYYYRVEVSKGGETILSPNKPLMYLPDSGPGPQKLLRGNYEKGYFGRFDISELVSAVDFANLFGLSWTPVPAASQPKQWLKFIYKGKVLFFPDTNGFFYNVSAADIYKAGLMYGTDDDTLYADGLKRDYGIVKQAKPMQTGGRAYIPRCPISRAIRPSITTGPTDLLGGEVDVLLAAAYFSRSYATSLFPDIQAIDDITTNSTLTYHTSDTYNATTMIIRGSPTIDGRSNISFTTSSTSTTYRPVLELVF